VRRIWKRTPGLPAAPGNHHYDHKQIFAWMERMIGLLDAPLPIEPRVEHDSHYSLAMMCSPGQCCMPMPPMHRTCYGERVQFDNREFAVEAPSPAGPIIARVEFELTVTTALHTHGDEELDDATLAGFELPSQPAQPRVGHTRHTPTGRAARDGAARRGRGRARHPR